MILGFHPVKCKHYHLSLCNFLRVHQEETRIEGNLWIDQERGFLFNVSHPRILNEQACPPIQIYATGIKDQYVTQDSIVIHLLEVDALNVEDDMDILGPQHREKVVAVRRKVGRKWMFSEK